MHGPLRQLAKEQAAASTSTSLTTARMTPTACGQHTSGIVRAAAAPEAVHLQHVAEVLVDDQAADDQVRVEGEARHRAAHVLQEGRKEASLHLFQPPRG